MKQINEEKIIKNYQNYFKKFGDTPEGVQYTNSVGQQFRFKKLSEIADLEGCSILDVGCGLGHLYDYLSHKYRDISYTGIDIVPETIAYAKGKYHNATFLQHNILTKKLNRKFDYVFINGVFNNAMEDSDLFIKRLLQKAFNHCEKGLAFNFLSTHVSYIDKEMAYHDPARILNHCIKHLSLSTTMAHCYERRDVAVFVYR